MMRAVRYPKFEVQRAIQMLIRTFPSELVVIMRQGAITGVSTLGRPAHAEFEVFRGEGLFVPSDGNVQRFGLGTVEEDSPHLLIAGSTPIKQGDLYTRNGRRYRVQYPPSMWLAWTSVTLKNLEQGTAPR
jgi:hypothetical protein